MADYILAMGGDTSSASVDAVNVFKTTANGLKAVTGHGLSLSTARGVLSAAACGNYILAMGGLGDGAENTVDVFHVTENGVEAVTDHGLTLSTARRALSAASCGNYILAMGGGDGIGYLNTVDVFHVTENGVEAVTDHGLTLSTARRALSAASCGNYILAMGGGDGESSYSNTVDVFHVTENGVEAVTDHGLTLSTARYGLAAASCGNYILAMGGFGSSYSDSNAVDVFHVTENGVEAVTDHGLTLSIARSYLAAASCGNYILAMGGLGDGAENTVDVFHVTENGVEHITDHGLSLSTARGVLSAAACGNYILAMGGNSSDYSNTVDIFKVTQSGVEAVTGHGLSLSTARNDLSAAACGNYILAMGGAASAGRSNAIDVFQIFN